MNKFVPDTIKLYQEDVKDDFKDETQSSNQPEDTIPNSDIYQKFILDESKQSSANEIYVKNELSECILTPAINIPNLVEIRFEHGYEFFVKDDGSCVANVSLVFYDFDKESPSYVHFDNFPLKKLDESKMPILLSA